ncbi:hypothetical protein KA005_03345 [bacterium]|nr:hypothetical protein [bacterium]
MKKLITLGTLLMLFQFNNIAYAGWVFAYEDSKYIQTKNHHCSSNCKGEPTRTTYNIELKAETGMRVRNPRLKCIAGPCGGWNSIGGVRVKDKGTTAVRTFDVWSKPTTWILIVDVYEKGD